MSNNDLYEQLIALNQACFDEGHYETSYHVLLAAKHYARDIENLKYLKEILQLAHKQSVWINIHAAENVLSQQATLQRNGINLYNSLFKQLEGDIQIVETRQKYADT